MCGLGAIMRTGGAAIPEAWIDRLDARLRPRGPDGAGRMQLAGARPDGTPVRCALVHRRLAIIDRAGGAQPMATPAGAAEPDVAVVFNGCIYDHRAVRRALVEAGRRFASDHSDTETLLHGWLEWEEGLFGRIDGMYALALWDRRRAELVLARDPFGEKPLYVGRHEDAEGEVTVAASDPRGVAEVLAAAGAAVGPSRRWLRAYLRQGWDPAGATAWGDAIVSAPTTPRPAATDPPPAPTDLDGWDALLGAAVRSRLESDVPVGVFLSGGVDSSLVALHAARARPGIPCFTMQMPDPRYDETPHARRVAAALGLEHRVLPVEPDPAADLATIVAAMGEPLGDSSLLPSWWIARAARREVAVAIGGDGGDELFLGYDRYRLAPWVAGCHRLLAALPPGLGAAAPARSRRHRLGRIARIARDWPRAGLRAIGATADGATVDRLLGAAPRGGEEAPPALPALGADAAATLRALDLEGYLPRDILRKVDGASMAVALEVRAPLLEPRFAAAALATPLEDLRRGGRKGLLRSIARRHLPAEIVDRPKAGFAIPIDGWLADAAHPLARLLDERLALADPFPGLPIEPAAARAMAAAHRRGAAIHGQRLFALLALALWCDQAREVGAASAAR